MTASKTMAKRAAAGTLALAVCLTGGILGAGSASAALGDLGAGTGSIRVLPSQDPTTGPDANSFQTAPVLNEGAAAAAAASFQVTVPNDWARGDRLSIALPEGVTFASLPTVTVSGPTTEESLLESTNGDELGSDDLVAPAVTTVFPVVSGGGVGAPSATSVLVQFNNSAEETDDDEDTVFVLNFTGVSLNVSDEVPASGVITATVTGQSVDANGAYFTTGTYAGAATTTIAYVSPVSISTTTAQALIPGGGPQSIGDITFNESVSDGLIPGPYTLTFTAAGPGATVTVDDTNPDGDEFDAEITGDVELDAEDIAETGNSVSFTVDADDLEESGSLESFVLKGLRLSPSASATAIQVSLSAAPSVTVPFLADQEGPLSDVDNEALVAEASIGIIPQNFRIGGNDRYETAAAVAQAAFPAGDSDTIIVASGEVSSQGVDALSANYLAGVLDAPILLTKSGSLPESTRVAIRNLVGVDNDDTANIYVVGGATAVSETVVQEIKNAFASDNFDLTVQRIDGDDRYATAANISTNRGVAAVGSFAATFGEGAGKTAIVAAGADPADALAAGAVSFAGATGAAAAGFPLLLTAQGSLPSSTVTALDSLSIKNVILMGGTTAVSAAVENQLKALDITVVRVAGADRYETAADLYELATRELGATAASPEGGLGWDAPTAPYLANGLTFADALVTGPLAGSQEQPLLLTQPTKLSEATAKYITDNDESILSVTGVGLSAALPQSVLIEANKAAQNADFDAVGDTPNVTTTSPAAGGNATPGTAQSATFSAPLSSASTATLRNLAGAGSNVPGTTAVSGNTITFTPNTPLPQDGDYTVTFNPVAPGGAVGPTVTRTFTTDVAPSVTGSNPLPGATAPVNVTPSVSFNEPIVLAGSTVVLTGPSGSVTGTSALNAGGTTLTFTPGAALTAGASYSFVVTPIDAAGNRGNTVTIPFTAATA